MARSDFRLRLHIHVGDSHSLGPGKAALLEAIRDTGSLSAMAAIRPDLEALARKRPRAEGTRR